MEFQTVVRKRRMVRAFEAGKPLKREMIDRILDNAQRGPSSGYSQGFEFLVFDTKERLGDFWRYFGEERVRNASLVVVPLADSSTYVKRYLEPDKQEVGRKSEADWPAPYWYIDTAFAAMLVLLTAVDLGLGAYYYSIGTTSKSIAPFKKAFGIPERYEPIGIIAIGYPSKESETIPSSAKRGRRARTEVLHFGKW